MADVRYPVVADPYVQRYNTGFLITFTWFETGAIATSLIFSSIWAARLQVAGAAVNQLTWNVWRIQATAAWESVHGKCLWVWAGLTGGLEMGGYSC